MGPSMSTVSQTVSASAASAQKSAPLLQPPGEAAPAGPAAGPAASSPPAVSGGPPAELWVAAPAGLGGSDDALDGCPSSSTRRDEARPVAGVTAGVTGVAGVVAPTRAVDGEEPRRLRRVAGVVGVLLPIRVVGGDIGGEVPPSSSECAAGLGDESASLLHLAATLGSASLAMVTADMDGLGDWALAGE
mmetsp:Transcript_1337/g.3470  ORF Transcript_1337/g.3470 Transcript_1337/m.3470 type:complete len:189 (-) Transcript_1337:1277-1843(-)